MGFTTNMLIKFCTLKICCVWKAIFEIVEGMFALSAAHILWCFNNVKRTRIKEYLDVIKSERVRERSLARALRYRESLGGRYLSYDKLIFTIDPYDKNKRNGQVPSNTRLKFRIRFIIKFLVGTHISNLNYELSLLEELNI